MALLSPTLSAMRTAGKALDVANAEFQKSLLELVDQLNEAMLARPFDPGNDALFDVWKSTARLAQNIMQVQTEFHGIHDAMDKSGASARKVGKTTRTTSKAVQKTGKKRQRSAAKESGDRSLAGNPAKVLAHLQTILNLEEFTKINRSAEAKKVGLPQGSMGAALIKLIQTGHLIESESGSYRLAELAA